MNALTSFLRWVLLGAAFLVMLGFALSNTDATTLRFFGTGLQWRAPLVLLLLAFFAMGCFVGLLSVVPAWYRGRREIAKLKRDFSTQEQALKAAAAARPGVVDAPLPVTPSKPLDATAVPPLY